MKSSWKNLYTKNFLLKENIELRDEIEQKVREYYDISLTKKDDTSTKNEKK